VSSRRSSAMRLPPSSTTATTPVLWCCRAYDSAAAITCRAPSSVSVGLLTVCAPNGAPNGAATRAAAVRMCLVCIGDVLWGGLASLDEADGVAVWVAHDERTTEPERRVA